MKRVYIGIAVFLVLLIAPVAIWFLDKGNELSVAIIDKTVAKTDYREHEGITWLLNYEKFKKENSSYAESEDYYGYSPEKEESARALPDDYHDYDVIYLADT